jgi:hypothetical protein
MTKTPDFESSTLWQISEFDRLRDSVGGDARLARQTLLSATLQAELRSLERVNEATDALEVFAACLRSREAALVYLGLDNLVWPVTLFPSELIYHSPRDLMEASKTELVRLTVIAVEAPVVKPPGHWMHERVRPADFYHPMKPAMWQLALHGRHNRLLAEIGGSAAYRALRTHAAEGLSAPGALGAAIDRLHRETAPLKQIARWHGMTTERATTLLNALYLTSNLMVTRTGPSARAEPSRSLWSRFRR